MPRLSKKAKQEWAFFLHQITHLRTYNEICRNCTRDCKQSYRAKIIECCRYESKRAVNYACKKHQIRAKTEYRKVKGNIPPALEKPLTEDKNGKRRTLLIQKYQTKGLRAFERKI